MFPLYTEMCSYPDVEALQDAVNQSLTENGMFLLLQWKCNARENIQHFS